MELALSSAALPGRTPAVLARACGPRGLAGIEIVLSDTVPSVEEAVRWRSLDAPVVALRAETFDVATSPELAKVAGILEAPAVTAAGLLTEDDVAGLAALYRECGATLLIGARTRIDDARAAAALVERVGVESLGVAWEIRPFDEDLTGAAEVLRAAMPHVLHVRLWGGGPEQRAQDGRGIGHVFVQLALARYRGAVAITPSDRAEPDLWERWVAGSGASGCGTKAQRRRAASERIELDVRPVEPKDRIDTVLGAYGSVASGGTLHLVVDHDPDCMHHLLTATQPQDSFTFEYLERGPEVWRVDVVRRT